MNSVELKLSYTFVRQKLNMQLFSYHVSFKGYFYLLKFYMHVYLVVYSIFGK